jgi:hypothetical protein
MIVVISGFFFVSEKISFALEYSNYSSEKFGIHFEYPSTWVLTEKTSRFDEGSDITISSKTGHTIINLRYYDDLVFTFGTSNLHDAVREYLKSINSYMFGLKSWIQN